MGYSESKIKKSFPVSGSAPLSQTGFRLVSIVRRPGQTPPDSQKHPYSTGFLFSQENDSIPVCMAAPTDRSVSKVTGPARLRGGSLMALRRAPKPFPRDGSLAPSARATVSRTGGLGRGATPASERLDELAERLLVHVGNGDIREARVRPARDVIAVDRFDPACPAGELGVDRQLGYRDDVLVVPIDERRRWDPVDNGRRVRPPAGSLPARDR